MIIAVTVAIAGPLALNITGIIKDVFLTYAGFIFFDDVKPTWPVLIGLGLSFAGAIMCIDAKMKDQKAKEEAQKKEGKKSSKKVRANSKSKSP